MSQQDGEIKKGQLDSSNEPTNELHTQNSPDEPVEVSNIIIITNKNDKSHCHQNINYFIIFINHNFRGHSSVRNAAKDSTENTIWSNISVEGIVFQKETNFKFSNV